MPRSKTRQHMRSQHKRTRYHHPHTRQSLHHHRPQAPMSSLPQTVPRLHPRSSTLSQCLQHQDRANIQSNAASTLLTTYLTTSCFQPLHAPSYTGSASCGKDPIVAARSRQRAHHYRCHLHPPQRVLPCRKMSQCLQQKDTANVQSNASSIPHTTYLTTSHF
jgi:hypothetical protein